MPPTPSNPMSDRDPSDLSFEEALVELQDIVARLESGDLTLEQTIVTFQQGSRLAQHCQSMIAGAELRITELASNDPGRDVVAEQASIQLPD